ncbi:PCMD domain-containing protein [Parabacteroides sp. PF5-9]|uniref:PCMD domain-containing protein n=1 Tax=Parabacteroides sp. PF5-9 TaxID=1742404 RepID=UPI0024764E5F|nr:PCMD domain-containing protein [Parabacteroides sp. PF5-9]MDH6358228.1 hypothetical protein [Parabacteroides sp. PF5-9]
MRTQLIPLLLLLLSLTVSCIQDEPLNPEADILLFEMPEEIAVSQAVFNRDIISVTVRKGADLSHIVPRITITEGATIVPDPSQPRDFNNPVNYTVTSADGQHQRIYTIQLYSSSIYKYDFELWKPRSANIKYETPYEYDEQGREMDIWDSTNKGIALYIQYPTAAEYPIHPTTACVSGNYAAEMTTRDGPGSIAGILYLPVIAGSLFTGVLNPLNAMIDPLLATQFGHVFNEKPERMRGYYKYKPGTGAYIAPDGNVKPGVRDSCALYSVFYRVDDKLQSLDGRNIRTHPNIVAMAMLPPDMRAQSEGDDFVYFDIAFDYKEGVEVDFEKYTYKLSTIFSSSFYGDRYEGVPGSHLVVDEIEIITEEIKRDEE